MGAHSSNNQLLKSVFPLRFFQLSRAYHWFVVGTVCIGAFMAALDASIINVVLPALRVAFHTRMHIIEWVSLSYILTLAALIVPLSRLADGYGRRKMYSFGFLVFICGSFLCGLAHSVAYLLVFRVIQAVGAAMLQANSVAIVTAATPHHDRGKAIGIQASAQGIGLSLGPALGGAVITFVGWQWIFFINVPVGIIGTVLALLILPTDDRNPMRESFDIWGSMLLAPTLVAFIYLLNQGIHVGWTSPAMLVSDAVFLLGFLGFMFTESRTHHPLVDFSLFRDGTFSFGNLSGMLSFSVMYAVMFLGPFYLNDVMKMSSFVSGLYMTMVPIGMTIFTLISGAVADKFGGRIPVLAGILLAAVGGGVLALMSFHYGSVGYSVGLFLVGSGIGSFTPPNNSRVMGSVPRTRLGIAGGMLNASRTIGMGLGVTLGGLSYQLFLQFQGVAVDNLAGNGQMSSSFGESFMVVAAIAICVIPLAALSLRERKAPDEANEPWDMYMI